ncbi:uncharacterized protein TNCV_4284981 [Trichonephila clavipes]|nr:uncharacterized protein TNCV_4284981 [Trichonephila clavipes]
MKSQSKNFKAFAASTKFVPLSVYSVEPLPLLTKNLLKACINDSVERDDTSSRWTARCTAHVNRTIYALLPPRKERGPAKSAPVI